MKQFFGFLKGIDRVLARGVIFFIKIYQKTFSPDHSLGGKGFPFCGCRFYPSCSQYGIGVLEHYGFLMGVPRMIWRILRCNPWSKGGVEFVQGDQPRTNR